MILTEDKGITEKVNSLMPRCFRRLKEVGMIRMEEPVMYDNNEYYFKCKPRLYLCKYYVRGYCSLTEAILIAYARLMKVELNGDVKNLK